MTWLKQKRSASGKTQKQIAQASGISTNYYCYIESGKRHPPVETAKKIAEVLGFDWTQFYDDDPRQNAS